MKQIPGGVTAPKGFRAWGVHCGVKSKKADKKDLALILSDQECAAAAVYTTVSYTHLTLPTTSRV